MPNDTRLAAAIVVAVVATLAGVATLIAWRRGHRVAATAIAVATLLPIVIPPFREPLASLLLAGALACLAAALAYAAKASDLGVARVAMLTVLRSLAIVIGLVTLFRPALPGLFTTSPRVAILLDASASMSLRDAPDAATRWEQAVAIADQLYTNETLTPTILVAGDVVRSADSPADLDQVTPAARRTDLASALTAARQASPRPDAIVLLSDGADTTGTHPADLARALDVPVIAVPIGTPDSPAALDDVILVRQLTLPPSVRLQDEAVAELLFTVRGNPLPTRLSLRADPADATTELASAAVGPLPPGDHRITLPVRFRAAGLQRLAAIAVPPVATQPAEPKALAPHAAATTFAAWAATFVTDASIRVLFMDGHVSPNTGATRQLLASDPDVQLTSVIRVRPDRTIVTRSPGNAGPDAVPRSRDDFSRFDLLVLGNTPTEFVNPAQQREIVAAVDQGTGLLLAGRNELTADLTAPLHNALPLRPGAAVDDSPRDRPKPTRRAQTHPVLRGTNFAADAALPEANTTPLGQLKPAAELLLGHQQPGGLKPVLAVQPFGAGRVAWLRSDTLPTWTLQSDRQDNDVPRVWRQLVRWAANRNSTNDDELATYLINIPRVETGQPTVLQARMSDPRGRPISDTTASLQAIDPSGQLTMFPAKITDAGQLEIPFKTTTAGTHQLRLIGQSNQATAVDTFTLYVHEFDERHAVRPEPNTLLAIASAAGRTSVMTNPQQLHTALAAIRIREQTASLVSHSPWTTLALFGGLLSLEWLLRRRFQLT